MRYKYKLFFTDEKEKCASVLSVNEIFKIFLNAKSLEDIQLPI